MKLIIPTQIIGDTSTPPTGGTKLLVGFNSGSVGTYATTQGSFVYGTEGYHVMTIRTMNRIVAIEKNGPRTCAIDFAVSGSKGSFAESSVTRLFTLLTAACASGDSAALANEVNNIDGMACWERGRRSWCGQSQQQGHVVGCFVHVDADVWMHSPMGRTDTVASAAFRLCSEACMGTKHRTGRTRTTDPRRGAASGRTPRLETSAMMDEEVNHSTVIQFSWRATEHHTWQLLARLETEFLSFNPTPDHLSK